jgi:dipeptidyl aminopeptidase/acylaminoacyl peptidase
VQTFAEQGYLIWLPNPRGSGGFGYQYRRANYRDWGYGDYRDIMGGVDLLIERGLADPERLGVMGWSYGGYMTSWIVTQTDRFKAASVGAGVTNPYSFYGVTDIPEFMEAYYGGKPWEDSENYLRHAAVNYAENAKTPTLIQHGQEDRRVPLSQGEEFYLALKKMGVHAEMVIYPRQPHGIQEPKLVEDAMRRNLAWFNKWLLGQ